MSKLSSKIPAVEGFDLIIRSFTLQMEINKINEELEFNVKKIDGDYKYVKHEVDTNTYSAGAKNGAMCGIDYFGTPCTLENRNKCFGTKGLYESGKYLGYNLAWWRDSNCKSRNCVCKGKHCTCQP